VQKGTSGKIARMKLTGYAKYAWGVVVFNIAVILWGAYVRASGSGAGCGQHWPTCQGAVIPRAPRLETLIEFAHRLSSGVALLVVIGLVVWAWRAYPAGHRVRRGAALSLVFILTEALLGAGLVLFQWVAHNDSVARAISMALHLGNTFTLLAMLTLTAWWASGGKDIAVKGQGSVGIWLWAALACLMALGMMGAVTALGDTLFPAGTLAQGLAQDTSPTAHFLIRLRVIHPLFAVLLGAGLVLMAQHIIAPQRPTRAVRWLTYSLTALYAVQLAAGLANIILLAPVWMQLVHLLLADLVWINLVLLTAAAFSHLPLVTAAPSAS
jgi:heme A synthase